MRFQFVMLVCIYVKSFVECNNADFGHIEMNGRNWTLKKPNYNNNHLNNTGTYYYFDGETVNLTCYLSDVKKQVNITTNAFDSKLTYKKPIPISHNVYLYMKLSQGNDGNYIDCLVSDVIGVRTSLFRIILHYDSGNPGKGFLVNGTYALQTGHGSDKLRYEYQFFDNENVLVKLRNNDLFTCALHNGAKERIFKYKLVEYHYDITWKCLADSEDGKILLAFVPNDAAGYTPVIKGLSMTKTLAMFQRNYSTFTILYEHNEDDSLSLDCVVKNPNTAWNIRALEASSDVNVTEYTDNCGSVKLRGKIKFSSTSPISGTLHCISPKIGNEKYPTITEIILVRTATVNDYSLDEQDPVQPKMDNTVLIVAGVGVFLLACLIMALIAFKLLKKKSITQNRNSQINYESLPEHSTGMMSIPQQWNEDKYSNAKDTVANNDYSFPHQPDVKEIYAEVNPKNKRAIKGDSANASIENLGPTYAKPVPKHLRDKNLANQLVYAELETRIQKPNIAKKPNVISKESPYAEIMVKDSAYVEPDNSESPYAEDNGKGSSMHLEGYVNVFDNERYVNANGKYDYAEPAYCELNNVHK